MIFRGSSRLYAAVAVAVLTGLAGCTSQAGSLPAPSPSEGHPSAVSSPAARLFVQGGDALQEQPVFDATNEAMIAANSASAGPTFLTALTAAGFDSRAMQFTAATTSAGLQAPSVQFSVLIGAGCLIGQYGPDATGYRSVVVASVNGVCLIGNITP